MDLRWLALCLGFLGASSDAAAIVVTHVNPAFPLYSVSNSENMFCRDNSTPCRVFGVGVVGYDYGGGFSMFCTATPIAPRAVLSAAHCFDGDDPGGEVDAIRLSNTHFWIPGVLGAIRGTPVSYPGYSGRVVDDRDIAVVILDQALPSWVPIFRLTSFNTVPRGAVVTHVGYGNTGTGSTGEQLYTTGGINIARNTIDSTSANHHRFTVDFDDPSGSRSRLGSGPVRESALFGKEPGWLYHEGVTARGDSGGPVLYNPAVDLTFRPLPPGMTVKLVPDEYEIVGVSSYISRYPGQTNWAQYGATATFVFTGVHRAWIQSVVPEAMFRNSALLQEMPPNEPEPQGVASNDVPDSPIETLVDTDLDLVLDAVDNCPYTPNYEQEDADGDGVGDACEPATVPPPPSEPPTYPAPPASTDSRGGGGALGALSIFVLLVGGLVRRCRCRAVRGRPRALSAPRSRHRS